MNNIHCEVTEQKRTQHGSLWRDSDGGIYILARTRDEEYAAISLHSANRWREPSSNIEYAVGNLTHVCNEATITIS